MYLVRLCVYFGLVCFDGSTYLYDLAVHPTLTANESIIDETLEKVWAYGTTFIGVGIRKFKTVALQFVMDFFISSRNKND